MGLSFWHLVIVLALVFILFGAGKLPRVMADLGKGIRNLREGLKGEDEAEAVTAPISTPTHDPVAIKEASMKVVSVSEPVKKKTVAKKPASKKVVVKTQVKTAVKPAAKTSAKPAAKTASKIVAKPKTAAPKKTKAKTAKK